MLACTASAPSAIPALESHSQQRSKSYLASASVAYASITKLTETSDGLQYLARLITALTRTISPLFAASTLYQTLRAVDSFIAAVRIIHDVKYLIGKGLEKDIQNKSWLSISHNVLFTVSDFTCSLDFCNVINLFDTSQTAIAIGNITVFGITPFAFVGSLSIGPIMRYSGYIGYLVQGGDCANRARHGETSTLNLVTLARAIMELAFRTFLILAGAYVVTAWGTFIAGCLGTVAASLAVASVYQAQKMDPSPSLCSDS